MQNERLAAGGLGCKVVFVSSVSSHRSFMRRTRTLLALRSARYLRGHALVLQKPGGHCCVRPLGAKCPHRALTFKLTLREG